MAGKRKVRRGQGVEEQELGSIIGIFLILLIFPFLMRLFISMLKKLPTEITVAGAALWVDLWPEKYDVEVGETINVTIKAGAGPLGVSGAYVELYARKPDGTEIFVDGGTTDTWGNFTTTFTPDTEGTWELWAERPDKDLKSGPKRVTVRPAEEEKPPEVKLEVTLTADKTEIQTGEIVTFSGTGRKPYDVGSLRLMPDDTWLKGLACDAEGKFEQTVKFDEEGTYEIAARFGDQYSDTVTITVTAPPEEAAELTLNVEPTTFPKYSKVKIWGQAPADVYGVQVRCLTHDSYIAVISVKDGKYERKDQFILEDVGTHEWQASEYPSKDKYGSNKVTVTITSKGSSPEIEF